MSLREEKLEKPIKLLSIAIIVCCSILLFPQTQSLIIKIGERFLGDNTNYANWVEKILLLSTSVILCAIGVVITLFSRQNLLKKIDKFYDKYFVFASILIVSMSIIIRIIMYVKCRSLWLDEAILAANMVTRTWTELLVPPLLHSQSAPVFYILIEKAIGTILGYSEFSLRLFSLLSFFGLLVCEIILLKKAFNLSNSKIAFVVVMTALLPAYVWYSNELKPYMSDAFFVVLLILLYFLYTKNKINLLALTALCVLILGFSSPTIFFTCGILLSEFFVAVFNKDKRKILHIVISGIVVLAVFGLYYYWWMSPVSAAMDAFWNKKFNIWRSIIDLINIFNGMGNSESIYVWIFVPFAIIGIYSMVVSGNKIGIMTASSLFFVSLASAIGKWPLTGRLWLFLPSIVFIFTPIGYDFIRTKIISKTNITKIGKIPCLLLTIFLTVNCLGYIGNKTYFSTEEINPLIDYVQRNIKEDEKLYIYSSAVPAFNFKNGYATTRIGNVAEDNIIYGENRKEWNESLLGGELQRILENKKTYLIFQHQWTGIENGLEALRNHGTLTEIMNVHDTPLYYFEKRAIQ
jgi:hypothetical protein